jgi:hypothetical protein
MKIAIIGGGWVGCHLAYKFKNLHVITLFEKNSSVFQETSYKNQNRLHLGYHYARNYKTRKLCLTTFDRFINDYNFLTEEIKNNLYCVASSKSLIDYETYMQIFKDFDFEATVNNFNNVDGCIKTKEKYINFELARNFFSERLKDIIVTKEIKQTDLKKLTKDFDYVINATNNHINDSKDKNFFFELTISFLYKRIIKNNFDSLTLVDGELFSIFPYKENLYTVTDVEHTPIKKFKKKSLIEKYKISENLIENKKFLIEKKIQQYYSNFTKEFKYDSYFISTKSKIYNSSDERYPIINLDGNIVNCFTGKIQGIYLIEDFIRKKLSL